MFLSGQLILRASWSRKLLRKIISFRLMVISSRCRSSRFIIKWCTPSNPKTLIKNQMDNKMCISWYRIVSSCANNSKTNSSSTLNAATIPYVKCNPSKSKINNPKMMEIILRGIGEGQLLAVMRSWMIQLDKIKAFVKWSKMEWIRVRMLVRICRLVRGGRIACPPPTASSLKKVSSENKSIKKWRIVNYWIEVRV